MIERESKKVKNTFEGHASEVFMVFLKLGLTSFGGPIAHLGYFRDELVIRRNWLCDKAYADLVTLCQFLPGPASSQVGFALGMMRAGWLGGLSAFIAFTSPSALALFFFAMIAEQNSSAIWTGALNGLKIVAVAIVAQALVGMIKTLCPDKERATIALAAVVVGVFLPGASGMVSSIILGAFAGLMFTRGQAEGRHVYVAIPVSYKLGLFSLALFSVLLITLPSLARQTQGFAVFDSFYRAGAFVFGGGHVVLPLLQAEVVLSGWVSNNDFLVGYGAAQAVPGPLFAFSAYLGTMLRSEPNGLAGAAIALFAIFLPGFLILIGFLPFWDTLRRQALAQSIMQGANAAVVGVLGTALYSPVFTSSVTSPQEFALALGCLVLLLAWKSPAWIVIIFSVIGGAALALIP